MALLVTAAGNYCYHKTFDVISNCVFDATKSIRTYFYELKSVLINGVKLVCSVSTGVVSVDVMEHFVIIDFCSAYSQSHLYDSEILKTNSGHEWDILRDIITRWDSGHEWDIL